MGVCVLFRGSGECVSLGGFPGEFPVFIVVEGCLVGVVCSCVLFVGRVGCHFTVWVGVVIGFVCGFVVFASVCVWVFWVHVIVYGVVVYVLDPVRESAFISGVVCSGGCGVGLGCGCCCGNFSFVVVVGVCRGCVICVFLIWVVVCGVGLIYEMGVGNVMLGWVVVGVWVVFGVAFVGDGGIGGVGGVVCGFAGVGFVCVCVCMCVVCCCVGVGGGVGGVIVCGLGRVICLFLFPDSAGGEACFCFVFVW